MDTQDFARQLAGGDRRSIGRSNRIVAYVLRQPQRLQELIRCLWLTDDVVRMRAADAIEKISFEHPEWFKPYKRKLLRLLEDAEQQELRWHLAVVIPRLHLTNQEMRRALVSLRGYSNDRSSIVKTCALQGLFDLSRIHPGLHQPIRVLLRRASRTGTPAMKARARKLLSEMAAKNSG